MPKHKLLSVTWIDSRRSSEQYNPEEFRGFPCALIETVGWGYEFEDKVVLASEYYPKIPDDQVESYRCIYSIPKSCIKEIKEYQEVK